MKFWQKILIYSVILFLVVFNIGAYILIDNSYKLNLKREIDRGLSEHLSIYSGVRSSIISIKNALDYSFGREFIYFTLKDYMEVFNGKKIYIEVLDNDNNEVFSNINLKVKQERVELKNPLLDKRQYIIRDVGDKTYIFITSLLEANKEYFKFTYIRDISYVYEDKRKQYVLFIQLQLVICIVLAIGMYILSKYITKPINKLIDTTKNIKDGNFSERVNIKSNDEIGILSDHFNDMTYVIEEKIFELEKNVEQKQRFIDNLTHELKTPLTSIIGYAEFLISTKHNEEVFFLGMNYILNEGKRLKNLSEKMMDLILFKKENFIMKKENIKNILLETKEILNNKIESKNIDLIIYGEEYEILVEKDLIKNLVVNLVDNAIKASNDSSKIYLSVYKDIDLKVILEVKDEGIGISEDDLPKVFEPFYMVDKSRVRASDGSGIGLSICAEIANVHKSKIEIESKLNQGTIVKIIFN
ncbi:signal transduction histidine kinase [Gottschalkia acidurici 9a]|uniref:histidine kinase n=1 Tax=Gottschalkia acidurici (strain ATCC 7906 / DSM 604 / BCRC 14475 / CIP 104303 / KCTC 5404 / NCIMB 10678 / 9a) TaxID=1128398 RepID=K0B185_GOTA9|nr:HAMP domain-containing sensor histidine kinase [Gottschalkia acidurici]AFS79778.1 signal transduction histidine kinase [Gottschalkia acidurici 9a]